MNTLNNQNTLTSNQTIKVDSITYSYDVELGQMYFNDLLEDFGENIKIFRENGLIIIGDLSKPYYSEAALKRYKKAVLWDLYNDFEFTNFLDYIENYSKQELIDELSNITTENYYSTMLKEGVELLKDFSISDGCHERYDVIILKNSEKLKQDFAFVYKCKNRLQEFLEQAFFLSPIDLKIQYSIVQSCCLSEESHTIHISTGCYDFDDVSKSIDSFYMDVDDLQLEESIKSYLKSLNFGELQYEDDNGYC